MNKKPKAIIFDWDNTLANTWPIIYRALYDTFTEFEKEPWTFEETKQRVHRSMRDAFPEIFGDKWEEAGKAYQTYYKKHQFETLEALPHAQELLDFLKPQDFYVAIVSNKKGENLRREVQHLAWDHYFKKVIGADDAESDKPSVAPVYLALDGSNIPLGRDVWMVGDSITDMEFAHNSGMVPIFYGDDDPTHERYKHCRPEKHIKHHKDLIELLKSIGS